MLFRSKKQSGKTQNNKKRNPNPLGSTAGRPAFGDVEIENGDDFITSSNGKSMLTNGKNVTQIHDGLVQSDPKDVAIFAKEGGPIGKFLNDLTADVHTALGNGGMNGGKINIELSGKLELSSGGQAINILEEMRKNPLFVRNLTQLLAENLSQAKNGGRGKSITSRLV